MIVPHTSTEIDPEQARKVPASPPPTEQPMQRFADILGGKRGEAIGAIEIPDVPGSAAYIFNENGFFRAVAVETHGLLDEAETIDSSTAPHVGQRVNPTPVPIAETSSDAIPSDPGGDPLADFKPAYQAPERSDAVVRVAANLDQRPGRSLPIQGQVPIVAQARFAPAAPATVIAITDRIVAADRIDPSPVPASARHMPSTVRSDPGTEVLVRPGDSGVQVLARIDGMRASDRASLRKRIIAMLSRYGFNPGLVRIMGGAPARHHKES